MARIRETVRVNTTENPESKHTKLHNCKRPVSRIAKKKLRRPDQESETDKLTREGTLHVASEPHGAL